MQKDNRTCVVCNKVLTRRQKLCCSRRCSASYGNSIAVGSKARNWRGGKIITSQGYCMLYMPSHPNANKAGYEYEHRIKVEEKLGRFLTKTEIVHHSNGIKSDNRVENLIVLESQGVHCQLHNDERKSA